MSTKRFCDRKGCDTQLTGVWFSGEMATRDLYMDNEGDLHRAKTSVDVPEGQECFASKETRSKSYDMCEECEIKFRAFMDGALLIDEYTELCKAERKEKDRDTGQPPITFKEGFDRGGVFK